MRSSLVLLLAACGPAPLLDGDRGAAERLPWGWILGSSTDALPEAPLHDRPIHLMEATGDGTLEMVVPTLPGLRSSADGRLGINPRRRGPNVELYLLSPEAPEGPLADAGPGVHGWLERELLVSTDLYDEVSGDELPHHYTLCDPSPDLPAPGESTNPHPCPDDEQRDCYDLTIVHSLGVGEKQTQLWGTPVHVEVSSPKTADATLEVVELGEPVAGTVFEVLNFKELNASGDGRLLVMRDDWSRNVYPVPDDPTEEHEVSINMVYAMSSDPDAYAPCDVRQWTALQPLSHFPHDPAVAHYPLAHFPFTDAEGGAIPDYGAMGASYPWIDRRVSMLFFMGTRATLFYAAGDGTVDLRYPARCVGEHDCGLPTNDVFGDPDSIGAFEDKNFTRGAGVMGLWTRGKMVLLDGIVNNTDYGLPRREELQRELLLYEAGTGPDPESTTGWVRVGTGFDNGLEGDDPPLGTSNNTAILESTTHLHFHRPDATSTWRDVVWTVSTAKSSQEVAFDDYLDVDGLIVAEMTASTSHTGEFARDAIELHDGFRGSASHPSFGAPVHVQNAASPDLARWAPPRFGLGYGGLRVEPVALGGIFGRGLWLHGVRDGVAFRFPEEPVRGGSAADSAAVDTYTGLFFDPRLDDDDVGRDLLSYPDGSRVRLVGTHALEVSDGAGQVQAHVELPWSWQGWHHLGLQRTDEGLGLTVFLDGFPFAELGLDAPVLGLGVGRVHLGDDPFSEAEGVRGWLDELKLFGRAMSPELACNHARGTLVLLEDGSDLHGLADLYPQASHDQLDTLLGEDGGRYVCLHDYEQPSIVAGNPTSLPEDVVPLRDVLLFPEGPLAWDAPRPDSVDNGFCTTCHSEDHAPSLSMEALALDGRLPAASDPRRQPSQAPARVYGVVPADFVGPGIPEVELVAPPEGLLLDPWVQP